MLSGVPTGDSSYSSTVQASSTRVTGLSSHKVPAPTGYSSCSSCDSAHILLYQLGTVCIQGWNGHLQPGSCYSSCKWVHQLGTVPVQVWSRHLQPGSCYSSCIWVHQLLRVCVHVWHGPFFHEKKILRLFETAITPATGVGRITTTCCK